MGHSVELTDLELGERIGCHLCQMSVQEISILLNMPRATVSAVMVKWKRDGTHIAQQHTGRPHLLTANH